MRFIRFTAAFDGRTDHLPESVALLQELLEACDLASVVWEGVGIGVPFPWAVALVLVAVVLVTAGRAGRHSRFFLALMHQRLCRVVNHVTTWQILWI